MQKLQKAHHMLPLEAEPRDSLLLQRRCREWRSTDLKSMRTHSGRQLATETLQMSLLPTNDSWEMIRIRKVL